MTSIPDILKTRGGELLAGPRDPTTFTGDTNADALLNNLRDYPHAFVIGCLMDRQWKSEKCWLVPFRFKERLGSFEFDDLKSLSIVKVRSIFVKSPPLHRMTERMADVFESAIQAIGEKYSGDASRIWQGRPSSATIVRRCLEFNGAGPKIATMAANILVRDFKVPVSDKYSIDISPDIQVRRTFERLGLIREGASIEELIYTARELNPDYPGVFDLVTWEIGRKWCRPRTRLCDDCYMKRLCPTARADQ